MFGITDLTAYLIGVIIIITLPGPNSLYCLSVSASQGRRAGMGVMSGILVGDTLLILATVFWAGTLLKLYPAVFDVIKLIGGCYLAYLGGYGSSLGRITPLKIAMPLPIKVLIRPKSNRTITFAARYH
ncbi:MAG: LysE family transporter [Moraxella equi]|nr:LysE family transporter [Moraxella equi]